MSQHQSWSGRRPPDETEHVSETKPRATAPARPDEGSPEGRLLVLLLVVGAWAVITVGIAFERAEITGGYQTLSLFVAVLLSRYWGLPARLLP